MPFESFDKLVLEAAPLVPYQFSYNFKNKQIRGERFMVTPPLNHIQDMLLDLPILQGNRTKTIVFDMDETLIHCVDDVESDAPDVIIPIQFSEDEQPVHAGINIRPKVRECLLEANKHFQVIVFTASEQEYADPILNYLDPSGTLFQARYYRQHCVKHQYQRYQPNGSVRQHELYVKDLRIFQNRSLNDIVLVDNSLYSFAFQLENGIPIIPFYDEPTDQEMTHLIFYLSALKDAEDVRILNRDAFQLEKLAAQNMEQEVEQIAEDPEEEDNDSDYFDEVESSDHNQNIDE